MFAKSRLEIYMDRMREDMLNRFRELNFTPTQIKNMSLYDFVQTF